MKKQVTSFSGIQSEDIKKDNQLSDSVSRRMALKRIARLSIETLGGVAFISTATSCYDDYEDYLDYYSDYYSRYSNYYYDYYSIYSVYWD